MQGGREISGQLPNALRGQVHRISPETRSVQFVLLSNNGRGAVAVLGHTRHLSLHPLVHEIVYATKRSIRRHVLDTCHGQTPSKCARLLKTSETPALPARSLCSSDTRAWKAVCLGERPGFESDGLRFEHQLCQCPAVAPAH